MSEPRTGLPSAAIQIARVARVLEEDVLGALWGELFEEDKRQALVAYADALAATEARLAAAEKREKIQQSRAAATGRVMRTARNHRHYTPKGSNLSRTEGCRICAAFAALDADPGGTAPTGGE